MPTDTCPKSVCVLADQTISEWQVRSLERMMDRTGIKIRMVVVNKPDGDVTTNKNREGAEEAVRDPRRIGPAEAKLFFSLVRSEGAWVLVRAIQKLGWVLTGGNERWSHMRPSRVTDVDCLSDAEFVYCTPRVEGAWHQIPAETVKQVSESCDVVVRFGFGLIRGAILDAPEYGVLSFHPADIRSYRGQGPEQIFLNNDDTAGVTLQRLSEDIDGGEIVAFGTTDVSDVHTYEDLLARIRDLQIDLLAEGVANLQDPAFEPTVPSDLGEYHSHQKKRRLRFVLPFLARDILGRVRQTTIRR